MVILLVSVCAVEVVLLIGVGVYAEFLQLKERQRQYPVQGRPAIHSTGR